MECIISLGPTTPYGAYNSKGGGGWGVMVTMGEGYVTKIVIVELILKFRRATEPSRIMTKGAFSLVGSLLWNVYKRRNVSSIEFLTNIPY
jgi:hypothetical protein